MNRIIFRLITLSLVGLLGGCATKLSHSCETIYEHVIAVNSLGRAQDPRSPNGREYSVPEFQTQIRCILRAIDRFQKDPRHKDGQILIFVHGGLNPLTNSLAAADSEMDCVMDAGYYPIYLDWDSDFFSTYCEHIVSITQGDTDSGLIRDLLIPGYVLADLGRAACRIPIVWCNQFASDIQSIGSDLAAIPKRRELSSTTRSEETAKDQRWVTRNSRGDALLRAYLRLRSLQDHDGSGPDRKEIRIYIGPDYDVDPLHLAESGAWYVATLWAKLVTEPLVDWLGTPSWQVMSRRTLLAFDGDLGGSPLGTGATTQLSSLGRRGLDAKDYSTAGAMEIFREELEQAMGDKKGAASQPAEQKYHITLIGHSMGTMVLNEWLRRDILEGKGNLYSNIVYMAAACSVRDFSRAVLPFLVQHPETQFYDLMLNPLADLREETLADFVPRGSLLVWLDDFLTDPQTPLDRTLGRWDNMVNATAIIPDSVKKQIWLKAFAIAPSGALPPMPSNCNLGPQEHGDFRNNPYWTEQFWQDQKPRVCNPCPKKDGPPPTAQCCQ